MSLRIELALCTDILMDEINVHKMTQKEVAKTYRLALMSSEKTDWKKVNQAIIERWSMSGLKRIKNMAWNGRCFT